MADNADLSASQLAGYARQAGFTGQGLVNIVAIALAESGGNPQALANYPNGSNAGGPEISAGLTQINTLAHPQYTVSELYDPLTNFKAAFQVSNGGTNFNPWSTWTNGAARSELASVQQALGQATSGATPSGTPPSPAAPSSSGGTSSCQQPSKSLSLNPLDNNITDWLGYYWCVLIADLERLGIIIGAAVVIIVGLIILFGDKNTPGHDQVSGVVRRVPEVLAA